MKRTWRISRWLVAAGGRPGSIASKSDTTPGEPASIVNVRPARPGSHRHQPARVGVMMMVAVMDSELNH